jgi:hypothetical protein
VKKVAVLGAGVMGAQIAAHLVNVKVPVVLFDLPAKEGPKNGIVSKAIEGLKKLKPSPLGVADDAALIQQANYEEYMHLLGECDLVIEAIADKIRGRDPRLWDRVVDSTYEVMAPPTTGLSISAGIAMLISRTALRSDGTDAVQYWPFHWPAIWLQNDAADAAALGAVMTAAAAAIAAPVSPAVRIVVRI